jgi:hypothetical protein
VVDLIARDEKSNERQSAALIGLKLILPDICEGCGTHQLAVIGPNNELHCIICERFRGHIGPKIRAFLTEILDRFGDLGRPPEITVRRAIGEIESVDLILSDRPSAGRLIGEQLARRRRLSRSSGGGDQRSK